jgi:hypothetical protein
MRRSFSNSSKTSSSSAVAAALALALIVGACGGGSGGSDGGGTPTPPPGGNTDVCSGTGDEADGFDISQPRTREDIDLALRKTERADGNPRGRLYDALWLNRSRAGRIERPTARAGGRDSIDIGDVAVVQDEGDLIESPNPYDLRNLGLRFTRNGSGGYDVRRVDGGLRTALGNRLTLTDDDSAQLNLAFSFPFFGQSHTTAFVNSDGNVTFEEEDRASTDRNVARLLTGPPRVAPFLADLDPSTGSGRVFGNAAADQYTVTWCGVRGFDSNRSTNAQLTLLPDGTIEFKFATVTLTEAVVGLSPGRTGDFMPVDLSASGPTAGGSGAVGERFADQAQLDTVEVARKFYQSHPDTYDQLVIWADQAVVDDAFAYEVTVSNQIRGIGVSQFDASGDFGSGGRLQSYTVMDSIGKYPEDPLQVFLGENNTVSVLGQEVGHRWLAFLEFRDHNGVSSDALLGRDQAHWSFFLDSDASVMEGNDIEDLGGGSFRTTAAVQRYSRLDQYAMGLIPPSQVPTFFYVENPTNVAGGRTAESAPRVGVTFNGTRRDVLIDDVIAVNGPRVPSSNDSPRTHRQAFVLVVGRGRTADSGQVAKIERIRRAWETFFQQATEGRMTAITTLR